MLSAFFCQSEKRALLSTAQKLADLLNFEFG